MCTIRIKNNIINQKILIHRNEIITQKLSYGDEFHTLNVSAMVTF